MGTEAELGVQVHRPRLEHVDAMRPIKQLGMISTHALLLFAPAASLATGSALLITHVSRFTFIFISAAMLVYAHPQLPRHRLRPFWRRRLSAVALPYLVWTAAYFLLGSAPIPNLPSELRVHPGLVADPAVSLENFVRLLGTGYFQLYYLLLLIELYLAFPAFLWLLRRTAGHHVVLVGVSLVLEVVQTSLIHWQVLPGWMLGGGANKELWNYQLYLVAGGVLAWHYEQIHPWLRRHVRLVAWGTAGSAALAEIWYFGGQDWWRALAGANGAEPFQPIVIPLYLGLTGAVYLLAVVLTERSASSGPGSVLHHAAVNSYGIYLCHAVFLAALAVLSWDSLDRYVPWPLVVLAAVAVVYTASAGLSGALSRLPGRAATVGRSG